MTEIDLSREHGKFLITTLIIVFGAIVHATVNLKQARDNSDTRFGKADFAILFIFASFSGMIFSFLARYFFADENMINLCASIGSFLGIAGVNTVGQTLLDVLVSRVKK